MNGVMIIPTGIGCEIGGHAGDATPAVKLIAACCDTLITHPNAVNGSDLNEMPASCLYVDGYMLDEFLAGRMALRPTRGTKHNHIMLLVNDATPELVNAANAARANMGASIVIEKLNVPLTMKARKNTDGSAVGDVFGWEELVKQIKDYDGVHAIAIATPITCEHEVALSYIRNGGVNPWGGVEALACRKISAQINKPVAHAPVESVTMQDFNEIVDPRIAAEVVSVAYVHCVLKGLHQAPRGVPMDEALSSDLINEEVDFMVAPYMCNGLPHKYCVQNHIRIIAVRENKTVLTNKEAPPIAHLVENYLEAAGVIMCKKAGITHESVRRPLSQVPILDGEKSEE